VLAAAFLGPLDFFIVNVSIPSIKADLGATNAEIQLLIAGYGLTYAVCLITGGRLGDIFGRKRMFLLGMAGFTLASTLCGLAANPGVLIAARVLQGITGAAMFPQVLSIIQVSFPPAERGKAFAIFGTVMGTASFAGNVLGGFLLRADLFGLGWRPVFLVNLPLGVVAVLATLRLVHESRSPRAARLDLGGVVLATLALLLLLVPLVEGRERGWPAWAFVCLAASLPALALFLVYERGVSARGGFPLMELGLFRDRGFATGLVTALVFYGGLSAFFLTFTLFMQEGLRLGPEDAGLFFAPYAVGFLFASSASVRLARRLGRRLIQVGAGLMGLSLLGVIGMTLAWGTDLGARQLVPALLVYGTGQGFVMPTLMTLILGGIPRSDAGSASGVLSTVQQVALSLGIAVIGGVFFGVLGPQPSPAAFPAALAAAMGCNVALLAATCVLVLLLPRAPAADTKPAPVE
jgi:EmrB/QacA subfamily drug resistance transporter